MSRSSHFTNQSIWQTRTLHLCTLSLCATKRDPKIHFLQETLCRGLAAGFTMPVVCGGHPVSAAEGGDTGEEAAREDNFNISRPGAPLAGNGPPLD
jgi:hypothetical protein